MRDRRFLPLMVVLYLNSFVGAFNNNLMNVALASIMDDFGVDAVAAQWSVSAYMIVTVVGVVSMAFFYRRFSLRKLFYTACACFVTGGVLALLAPNLPLLVLGRCIQGVGTGISQPLTMNTILVVAKPERRGFMLALSATIITLAPAVAPAVGGSLVTFFGWHAIFVPGLLISCTLALVGIKALHNVTEVGHATFDVASAVLMALGLVPLAIGLTQLVAAPAHAAVFIVVGAAILAVFVWRQSKLADPFLNLRPLRLLGFWPACIMVFVALMTSFAISVLIPLYFEAGLGTTAMVAGLCMVIPVLCCCVAALCAGNIIDRFGGWPLIPLGMTCMAGGLLAAAGLCSAAGSVSVVALVCLATVGVGLTSAPSQTSGLIQLPPEDNPHGVALTTATIQLAGCVAPTLFVGVMNAVQANQLAVGVAVQEAARSGVTAAFGVAGGIAIMGLITSILYCYHFRVKR